MFIFEYLYLYIVCSDMVVLITKDNCNSLYCTAPKSNGSCVRIQFAPPRSLFGL